MIPLLVLEILPSGFFCDRGGGILVVGYIDFKHLVLMLWAPGVTHAGAYHRPSDGNFLKNTNTLWLSWSWGGPIVRYKFLTTSPVIMQNPHSLVLIQFQLCLVTLNTPMFSFFGQFSYLCFVCCPHPPQLTLLTSFPLQIPPVSIHSCCWESTFLLLLSFLPLPPPPCSRVLVRL